MPSFVEVERTIARARRSRRNVLKIVDMLEAARRSLAPLPIAAARRSAVVIRFPVVRRTTAPRSSLSIPRARWADASVVAAARPIRRNASSRSTPKDDSLSNLGGCVRLRDLRYQEIKRLNGGRDRD